MSARARDIFLSHSSADADAARELRAILESAGYSCWMAPDDVVGTMSWAEQILGAIDHSRLMLVLISGNANSSEHVSREVNLALGRKRAVLPIRIENVAPQASLEYLLSLVQRLDAFPPPVSTHAERILKRIAATIADEQSTEVAEIPPPPLPAPAASASSATTPAPTPGAPTPATLPLGPGSRVGAFTIEAVLGEGGMATVFRARQEEPSRSVALKVIRADHAADPAYRQRFLAEKDTLASLEHPSIVPIYAAGEADGVLYIAMRLVDGPDLATRLKAAGRLGLAETIALLRPIADAVDYAHEMGVVHRDLKPSNIMLDRKGRPYLTDFGLGKHISGSQGLSSPGMTVGTLEYMAPEQFTGVPTGELAGRIDVYALTCVVYACLTGGPPFAGETVERLMYAHVHEAAPPMPPDLPTAIDAAVRSGLAKNPADRIASGRELIAGLEAVPPVSEERTVPVALVAPGGPARLGRSSNRLVGSIALVAALALVGTGVVALNLTGATPSPGPTHPNTAAGSPGETDVPGTATPAPATASPQIASPSPAPPTPAPPTLAPADLSGPTLGAISLSRNGNTAVTTSQTVTVSITTPPTDASNVCARKATNTAVRPASDSSGWVNYPGGKVSFSHSLADTSYGVHTVRVWFRDCSSNRNVSATAATDSIRFDHAPVANSSQYWNISGALCNGTTLGLLPYVASDADGASTIKIKYAWTGSADYANRTTDYTPALTADGTGLVISLFSGTGSVTVYFIVQDSPDKLQDQGYFTVNKTCP